MDIFQKIINKEIPATIIYEGDGFIAFNDIKPKTPGHFLVIPKVFSKNLFDITDEVLSELILKARELAKSKVKELNVSGFTLTINNGEKSGQEVFRTHVHIIPSKN